MKARLHPAQLAGVLIAAGLLVWFCLPGFFNAGTFLGILLSLIIGICSVFAPKINAMLKSLWRKIPGRIFICAVMAAAAIFLTLCGYNGVQMVKYSSKQLEQVNCVMILGCQVKWDQPGGEMLGRLNAALPLIEEYSDVPVLVTGGQGRGENISEAECMKQWLVANGVSESRIYTESESESTEQNFEFSIPVFEQLGIYDGIAVVTNDFHQYRAELYARRSGLSTGHYSSHTRAVVFPNYIIRELAALFFV